MFRGLLIATKVITWLSQFRLRYVPKQLAENTIKYIDVLATDTIAEIHNTVYAWSGFFKDLFATFHSSFNYKTL